MKYFIINIDYLDFLHWLYTHHLGLKTQPFEEQMRVRYESEFGMADFYSRNLCNLGHEGWDVIANIESAQKQWAREHGTTCEGKWHLRFRRGIVPWPYRGNEWLLSILAAQIRAYRPDVLYSIAIETIGSDFLRSVKGYYRLAVGQHAAPLPIHDVSEYDLMLSSLPNQVEYFRKQGMASELFRLGFEPRILSKLSSPNKRFDLAFVGGLSGLHQQGSLILDQLCRRYSVKVWGYGSEGLPKDSQVRTAYRGSAWGIDMYQVLRDSKIVFNRHVIDVAAIYANNMRLYETTGVGTFLITDQKVNLHEMFEPGKEVATYRTPEECAELVGYYLEHDNEREAIARLGQERTLREHTYYHRMQELIGIVQRYI